MANTVHTFAIEGMHCGSCALLVDDALEELPGVLASQTSVKRGSSVVEVDPGRCVPEEIVAAVTGLGYTARLVR
ncbi:MAG: heavy-metal-associated domain-containing protein [Pseudonocardia sp.]